MTDKKENKSNVISIADRIKKKKDAEDAKVYSKIIKRIDHLTGGNNDK